MEAIVVSRNNKMMMQWTSHTPYRINERVSKLAPLRPHFIPLISPSIHIRIYCTCSREKDILTTCSTAFASARCNLAHVN